MTVSPTATAWCRSNRSSAGRCRPSGCSGPSATLQYYTGHERWHGATCQQLGLLSGPHLLNAPPGAAAGHACMSCMTTSGLLSSYEHMSPYICKHLHPPLCSSCILCLKKNARARQCFLASCCGAAGVQCGWVGCATCAPSPSIVKGPTGSIPRPVRLPPLAPLTYSRRRSTVTLV